MVSRAKTIKGEHVQSFVDTNKGEASNEATLDYLHHQNPGCSVRMFRRGVKADGLYFETVVFVVRRKVTT